MTDNPNDRKDQPPTDPKRPHATLNLKATEVKAEGSKSMPDTSGAAGNTTSKGDTGAAKPETQKLSADPPAKRSPSAFTRLVTHLAAGLAGGAIVLFGGDRFAQLIGTTTPAAQLQERTSELDKRIAALEAAPKSDAYDLMKSAEERLAKIDQLGSEVEALKSEQSRLAQRTDNLSSTIGSTDGLSAMQNRVAALEDQLKTIAAAASSDTGGNRIADIAALTTRLSDSEMRFSGEVSKLRDGLAREIDDRLAVREDASKSDLARLSQTLEKLKADQTRVDKSVQAAQEEAGRVASGLEELKQTLERQTPTFAKAEDISAAVAPVSGRISSIEENLESIISQDSARQSNAERIVTALELGNLKRAIDSGKGFTNEFEAVSAASSGRLNLKPLEPFKSGGVPSLTQIKKEARPALFSALDAASTSANSSVWDRMLANARSIVRVRKTDVAEGDESAEATVARIDKHLEENNLAEVLSEVRKLPPEAAAKLTAWTEKVAARQSIDEALATIENELKAALTSPTAAPPPVDSKE
jgi:hypothetical protein